jgi:hypothetical protein
MKVGDLKKVQSQQHLFESSKEPVSDTEGPDLYEILIPSSATKAQIADLKSLLRAVASTSKTAVGVQVQLEGKKIPIPLKVNADEALESKIAAIFK